VTLTNDQATKAPGWYRDPEDPALIRYWDGTHWTGRQRPRPSWGPALTAEEEAAHRAALRRRQWWLRGSGSLLLVAAVALTLVALRADVPAIPPRSVSDTAFTTAANDLCAQRMPGIRSQPPQTGSKEKLDPDAATAARMERTAADLAGLVAGLRRLPLAEADRVEVAGWFDHWDRFVDVGRRYAAALRGGKNPSAKAVGAEAAVPSREIYRFAKANGMPECIVS
jgi:uncharacterized protein DUF2510